VTFTLGSGPAARRVGDEDSAQTQSDAAARTHGKDRVAAIDTPGDSSGAEATTETQEDSYLRSRSDGHMTSGDDPLAEDLRSFSQSRHIAKEDEAAAAAAVRDEDNRTLEAAPAAIAKLREAVGRRANQLASAEPGYRVECISVGNTTTVRLDIVEANMIFNRGRPADAFGPILPSAEFILSRTSLTIGADLMPPDVRTYSAPPRESEQLRLALARDGAAWEVGGDLRTASQAADYILGRLVAYFKVNAPR
jgi:hypothetical protein